MLVSLTFGKYQTPGENFRLTQKQGGLTLPPPPHTQNNALRLSLRHHHHQQAAVAAATREERAARRAGPAQQAGFRQLLIRVCVSYRMFHFIIISVWPEATTAGEGKKITSTGNID